MIGGFLLLSVFSLTLGACGGDDEGDTPVYDYEELLTHYANWIEFRTGQVVTDCNALEISVTSFKEEPNAERLKNLRSYHEEAYGAWQLIDFLTMGPAADEYLVESANTFPAKPDLINENIAEGNTNLDPANQLSAQGFPALDYMLFHADEDSILSYLQRPEALTYLEALVTRLNTKVKKVKDDWATYEAEFIADSGNDAGSSMAVMFNAFVENFERRTRDGKFGIPAGVRTDNEIQPGQIESLYNPSLSIVLARKNVVALKDFFIGSENIGFDDQLNFYKAERDGEQLSKVIIDQFNVVIDRIDAIDTDMATVLVEDKAKVLDVFNEMQKLVVYLKVDMASELGILINYADNDGDS